MNGGAYWSIPAWNDKDDYYSQGAKKMSQLSIKQALEYENDGSIDSLENLKKSPVFIITGSEDNTCPTIEQNTQHLFYKHFESQVHFKTGQWPHTLVTDLDYEQ